MDAWDMERRPVKPGYPPYDVQKYCVKDREWQGVRLSMKGKSTTEKLDVLAAWYDKWSHFEGIPCKTTYPVLVQVGNYLGALRRGGQLDMQNRVQR